MNLSNKIWAFILLFVFSFMLSCEKEDNSYPHPPELGFRNTYTQNKADLDKLVSLIKDDLTKTDEEIVLWGDSRFYNIPPTRADEYKAITSKLSGFYKLSAKKINSDNFNVTITLYDSHKDIVTCKEGLFYSTQTIANSSSALDSIKCSSLFKKTEPRRFNKIEGNWYIYLEGFDNYVPH